MFCAQILIKYSRLDGPKNANAVELQKSFVLLLLLLSNLVLKSFEEQSILGNLAASNRGKTK